MGEAAKAFWLEEEIEQEQQEQILPFEDVSYLSTGISDDLWKCGAD
jgi:hypothetical protein